MIYEQALSMLNKHKLVAILRGIPQELSLEVAKALYRGGVRVLEFTYDHALTDCLARNSAQVSEVVNTFGDDILVGCGTVLTTEEVEVGWQAGARLIISPNTDEAVIAAAHSRGMISMPGALTSTEIVTAHRAGADIVKLFPSGALGIGYIKAVRAPLKHIPMSAVGGVKPETIADFLDAGICSFGVGSEMVRKQDLKACDMKAIEARAREFVEAIAAWEAQHA